MNLGIIARADRRGLAALTANVWRNMTPTKTVVIDMGAHRPFGRTPGSYPGAEIVDYDDCLRGRDWSTFLEGLDAVWTAETPYDFGLIDQARRRGVKTVVHVMPEYDPWTADSTLPPPDVVALPTCWLAERYPDAVVLPVPVEPIGVEPGEWLLHPAGGPAAMDRNGTRIVIDAARAMRTAPWLIRAQELRMAARRGVRFEIADHDDRRDVYAGAQLVALPRRYAGLSLALQDAMGAGLPVLATNASPYGDELHPASQLRVSRTRTFTTWKDVRIPAHDVAPQALARATTEVLRDESLRDELAKWSRAWADAHSWQQLRAAWDAVLAG